MEVISDIDADGEHVTQRRNLTGSEHVTFRPVDSSLSILNGSEPLGIVVGPVSRQLGQLPMPLYLSGRHSVYSKALCLHQAIRGIQATSRPRRESYYEYMKELSTQLPDT
ncbi:hypothetical protein O1611_g8989 [Lasiodiplodia mahajangana]|uniref:Uncharacterized protein n=1 Tax=Lasiodiplodia mahajangana TaxID=1108764 RepID=A0ACC2JB61_9PEZI|nr:hypothetical protein O1611_g8989 [Lasiodiplodia mahajangana]